MDSSKRVDSTGINRLAVRFQKLFYEVTFSHHFKVQQSKIEIPVGISIFVGRYCQRLGAQRISANLGPLGKNLVGYQLLSAASQVYSLYV